MQRGSEWFDGQSGKMVPSARRCIKRSREFGLSSQEFVDALGLPLLLPPYEDVGLVPMLCTCRHHTNVSEKPLHFLASELNSELTIARHNEVRDTVTWLIRKWLPEATVSMEVTLPTQTATTIRADIHCSHGHVSKYLDAMIVHPSASSYLHLGSATTADTATRSAKQASSPSTAQCMVSSSVVV